jgi:hypothetical protein
LIHPEPKHLQKFLVSIVLEMECIWDATWKTWIVLKELFHFLAIPGEGKDYLSGEVLNFCEEKVKHSFPTIVVSFRELVCFIDKIDATFRLFEFLEVGFDLSDPTMRET